MDAWIDCMTSIDVPDDGMTSIHCENDSFMTIELENVSKLRDDRAEFLEAIVDCVAFVNWSRIESGDKPVLALSYYRTSD